MSQARHSTNKIRSGIYSRTDTKAPQAILSFAEFKARYVAHGGDCEPTNYDPTLEQFPDDEWYKLEHDKIITGIHQMCSRPLELMHARSPDDTEVSNLDTALRAASGIPRGRIFYAAFLGEQGIGKSSLVNAIFGRDFVRVSGSSSACTAYPTVIVYKDGAKDNATDSDVTVEIMNDDEVRDFSREQGRRYRDVHPRREALPREQGLALESDDDSESEEDDAESEEDDSDSEENERSYPVTSRNDRPNAAGNAALRAAKTARSFFELLFDTKDNEDRQIALDEDLKLFDLESEDFLDLCVEAAKRRKEIVGAQDESLHYVAVDDETLKTIQDSADEIWPLIKSVRIATGHVLLRNNVYILDLPGYGDDNHIRKAQIDRFRNMANFEIVVAPTSRVVSSVVQERYLDRSIRRLGAHNTLLVLNKSDSPLTSIRKQIKTLEDDPFPQLQEYFTTVEAISKQKNEDGSLTRAYREHLLGEARVAWIENEVRVVREGLQNKRVDILAVSARQYSLCLDIEYEDEKPILTPEATGIPKLRRYLFSLPSQTNYRTLHHHIFETLPDIVRQIQRILEKVEDNDGRTTKMREDLAKQLPLIRKNLAQLSSSLPTDKVARPFDGAKSIINAGLKTAVEKFCSNMYHGTFVKMLRENGMPLNGKGQGTNFNQCVLNEMVRYIETWRNNMQSRIDDVAVTLDEPVQDILKTVKKHIDGYDGDSELKRRVGELLDNTTRRIGMSYGKTVAQLQSTLHANHFRYSNEDSVECPVALEMKSIYQSVFQQWSKQPGKGSYARGRAHMLERLRTPDLPALPFSSIMGQRIVDAQVNSWKQCCEQYVTEAMTLLQDFARAINELLDVGALLTSEHRRIREQLQQELPQFQSRLERVRRHFPGGGVLDPSASVRRPANTSNSTSMPNVPPYKRKVDNNKAATQPPGSHASGTKRVKTESQPPQFHAMASVRERYRARMAQIQEPVVKRDPSP